MFEKICPGEEFLPRAPNPEDIIYDDGEGNQPKESGFEPAGEADQPEGGASTKESKAEDGKPYSGCEYVEGETTPSTDSKRKDKEEKEGPSSVEAVREGSQPTASQMVCEESQSTVNRSED